ncbi:hypothetical protein B7463_g10293, partial [Scytalidium lignicola]
MPATPNQQDAIQNSPSLNAGGSSSRDAQKIWIKRYRTEIAASMSSVLSTFVAFPLDSVKTRMQTYRYNNFTDCVRHTYQTEKFRGFFRGVTAPLASITIVRTISFSVYQRSKYRYAAWMKQNFGIDPLVHVNTQGTYPNLSTVACFGAAGATAGSFITLVACPFELTKLSAQVSVLMAERSSSSISEPLVKSGPAAEQISASYQNKGTLETAKNIIKNRGLLGLYSGFKLHLLRDTLGTAIYFMTYESSKQLLTTYRGDQSRTHPLAVVIAGGLCGVASWALIYPIDSAKSIYQRNCLTHRKGETVKAAPKIQFGNKRMYRGLGVSMGRKAAAASAAATISARRSAKREHRKQEKKKITAHMWAAPAPPGLVAKLDVPRIKSKYHSYFEFAENTEKKKKLECQVTDNATPPPGFEYVPIGNPELTKACKELSREQDAMIFIVSGSKETNSRISDHVFRTGYHFRSTIVEKARKIIGEAIDTENAKSWGYIEPIPESQEEINKQADAAIRDLFPRIPNTDRQLIIQHAFQKGALFHGEATVGLQPDIPLWRRVQLAVVAHIRHNHTRYDKLLRETSWMNARKVVEPVCLDVLVKWRGDEETGRDQLDEILREVVVITDSEDNETSSEEDTSEEDDEDGEFSLDQSTSTSQHRLQQPLGRPQPQMRRNRDAVVADSVMQNSHISSQDRSNIKPDQPRKDKRAQRGFKRYQAAWEQAVSRQQKHSASSITQPFEPSNDSTTISAHRHQIRESPSLEAVRHAPSTMNVRPLHSSYYDRNVRRFDEHHPVARLKPYYPEHRLAQAIPIRRNEVNIHPLTEHHVQYRDETTHSGTTPYMIRDQERPHSAVFRRPSPRHGLQDMLVPSIESPAISSAPALPPRRADSPKEPYIRYEHPVMPPRRQVFQTRRESPSPQVIVISDDSPKVKRQRLLYEDDTGHFKPVQNFNSNSSFIGVHHEVPSKSSMSLMETQAQRQAFPPSSNQGLFHDSQTSMSTSFVPMQDSRYHHSGSGVMPRHLDQIDGAEHNFGLSPKGEAPPRRGQSYQRVISNDHEHLYSPSTDNANLRVIERGEMPRRGQFDFQLSEHTARPISPAFPVSSRVSRSHEMRTGPAVADQTFIHRFSQSRLGSTVPEAREDSFIVLPQKSHRNFVQHVDPRSYVEQSTRLSTALDPHSSSGQPWDIVQRPHDSLQTVYPGRLHMEAPPRILREQPLNTPQEGPVYVRPTPRRQVIVLD